MVVETVRFHQVDDIESILLASSRVSNAEIVPLGVASRVVIWLQDQVVLILVHLNCSAQVTRFEARLEEESVVLCTRRDVKRWHITCFRSIRGYRPGIWRWVDGIVDYTVKKVFLVNHSLSFSPQTFF